MYIIYDNARIFLNIYICVHIFFSVQIKFFVSINRKKSRTVKRDKHYTRGIKKKDTNRNRTVPIYL